MISTGFPDLLQFATFDRSISTTKRALTDASQELVTGQKAELSRALAAQAGEYNLVQKALQDIENNETRLGLVTDRFATASSAMGLIRQTVNGFGPEAETLITSGGATGDTQVRATARSYLETVFSTLNTSHAGRKIFAGDEVGSRAIASAEEFLADLESSIGGLNEVDRDAAIDAYFADGGQFDTAIYDGGAGNTSSVELLNGAKVQNTVRADDPAFKSIIEGLARVAFSPTVASEAWAENVNQLLTRGETGLIDLEADLGRQQRLVDESLALSDEERIILNETTNRLAGVDAFEAANRVQQLEVQLTAAFQMTSRLSQLTLSNFI